MTNPLRRILRDERGATAIEYGLIVSLIVLAIVGSMSAMADNVILMWNNVADQVIQ